MSEHPHHAAQPEHTFVCDDCQGAYDKDEMCRSGGGTYCPVCHIDRFDVELHSND